MSSTLAAVSAVLLGAGWLLLRTRRGDLIRRHPLPVAVALAVMVALNPLSYIIGTGITYPATGMLLVIVGVGGLLYDRFWAAGIIIALNLGWVLCAAGYGLPVPAAVFAAQLFKANALAIVLAVIRARTVRRLEQTRRDIHRLAVTDPLTGLANQRGLLAAAGTALSRRPPVELCVVYLDIDGLKDVNDRYGHDAGDQLIRSVATVLRGVFRPQDTIARIGGDEFAVLLIGADPRLTQQLLTSVHQDLHQAGISVSAGTAETTPDSFDAELADLLDQADPTCTPRKPPGKTVHAECTRATGNSAGPGYRRNAPGYSHHRNFRPPRSGTHRKPTQHSRPGDIPAAARFPGRMGRVTGPGRDVDPSRGSSTTFVDGRGGHGRHTMGGAAKSGLAEDPVHLGGAHGTSPFSHPAAVGFRRPRRRSHAFPCTLRNTRVGLSHRPLLSVVISSHPALAQDRLSRRLARRTRHGHRLGNR